MSTSNLEKIAVKSIGIFNKSFSSNRSSRPEVFCKEGIIRNLAKLTGEHLCQSLFFNKVAGLRHATLIKRVSGTGDFFEISENTFFYRTPPVAAPVLGN